MGFEEIILGKLEGSKRRIINQYLGKQVIIQDSHRNSKLTGKLLKKHSHYVIFDRTRKVKLKEFNDKQVYYLKTHEGPVIRLWYHDLEKLMVYKKRLF